MPVVFFYMLCLLVEKASKGLIIAFAGMALLIFSSSTVHMNIIKAQQVDTWNNSLTAEFQRIADLVGTGRRIFIHGNYDTIGGSQHAVEFYLAGNYFQPTEENVYFSLSDHGNENRTLLTSQNQRVFLYKGTMP
jgi:hypothetical protein